MNAKIWLRLALAALLAGVVLHGCQKEEDFTPVSEQDNYTIRPDFATLDHRPAEVIALYTLTARDAEPVLLKKGKPGPKPTPAGKFALVVGISDYEGTANDLSYCDDDATDWKAKLQSEGYSVTLLLDRAATASAIDAAVTELASKAVAGSEIAFCYSGHGSKGNMISTDLYYMGSSWLGTKFANAASTKMMFCFDACQIGAMSTALGASGRVVAVASSASTLSYDGDESMKNGVFTYYQMQGFDTKNYVYLEPDCQYACDQMKIWASAWHLRVAPSFKDGYAGEFDL